MTKKEREAIKKYDLSLIHMTLTALLEKEGCKTGKSSDNSCNSCNNGTKLCPALPHDLTIESALVNYNPTFMGYLIAILRLLKQAFFHKKGIHFIVVR